MKTGPAPLTQEEHLLLNELVSAQFGITFPEHKRAVLESRLRPRLVALHLPRYYDYYLHLQCDTDGERSRLAELVTNNETFFFRETHQFDSLFEEAADELKAGAAAPGTLRILCAGCSSGEEPYTLALWSRQHFVRWAGTELVIDAFDLDASRVEMARRAEYGRSSLRSATPEQVDKLFAPVPQPAPAYPYAAGAAAGGVSTAAVSPLLSLAANDRWTLRPAYRTGVRFAWGNILAPDTYRPAVQYDALFCRNVLIYFAEPALHAAVRHFAQMLRPGGLLFLGASESIIGLSDQFETVRLSRSIAYRKVGGRTGG
jgi:chemotaxis protein methyltransferase CheR